MKKTNASIGFFLATVLVAACSSGISDHSTDSVAPTTTQVVMPAKNPMIELGALARNTKAVDYSRLSINHDGIFAVVIRDKRVGGVTSVGTFTFWRWDGNVWNDVSGAVIGRPLDFEFFESGSKYGANVVTSYDYNQDGIVDFLVEFNEKDLGLNHSAGAILSSRGGQWHWESFMYLDGSIGQVGTSMMYDPDTNELTFRDYPSDRAGYQAEQVTLNWDAQRGIFVADPNTYRYLN